MGGGSGSSDSTTSDLFVGYHSQLSIYLKAALGLSGEYTGEFSNIGSALFLYDNGFDYRGETYAPQGFDETDGIARLVTRATDGSIVVSKIETLLRDTYDGTKINSNPKLDDLFTKRKEAIIQELEEETLPRIDSNFNAIGRFGGGSHHATQAKAAEAALKRLTEVAYEVYGAGYWAERAIQNAAIGLGIAYGTQDVKDAELLRQAGLYKREFTEGGLQDTHKRFQQQKDAKVKRLEVLGNAVRLVMGSHVTKTEPVYVPSKFAQVAGIALAGMGLYGMMRGQFGPGQASQGGASQTGPMATHTDGSLVPHYTMGT